MCRSLSSCREYKKTEGRGQRELLLRRRSGDWLMWVEGFTASQILICSALFNVGVMGRSHVCMSSATLKQVAKFPPYTWWICPHMENSRYICFQTKRIRFGKVSRSLLFILLKNWWMAFLAQKSDLDILNNPKRCRLIRKHIFLRVEDTFFMVFGEPKMAWQVMRRTLWTVFVVLDSLQLNLEWSFVYEGQYYRHN